MTRPPKTKKKHPDRFHVFNAYMDFTAKSLKRSDLLVWLMLYRDTRNGTAQTAQRTIAKRCGVSRKTVERSIANLVKLGLLRVVYKGGFMRGTASYVVIPVSRETVENLTN